MRLLQHIVARYCTVRHTIEVFLDMGLGWLLPVLLLLLALSLVFSLLAHFGPLAPFVYPLL